MKTQYWLLFVGVLLLFLYFMPRPILYSDYKIVWWCICGLILFLIPYLVYKMVNSFVGGDTFPAISAALSVLIVGPTFGLYHGQKEVEELKQKGVWTKATVTDKKYFTSRRYYTGWTVQFVFKVNGAEHKTHYYDDKEDKLKIGDTLDLIYSKDFPAIYEIGYEWRNKNESVSQ